MAEERFEELTKILKLKAVKVRGTQLSCICPNPTHRDKHPSFGINLETGEFNCFSCEFKGQNFYQLFVKLGKEAPEWAFNPVISIPKKFGSEVYLKGELDIRQSWLEVLCSNPDEAKEELAKRDVKEEIAEKFRVGFNVNKEILFFPIFDTQNNLIGWVERSDHYAGRYLVMPKNVEKENLLYGSWLIPEGQKNNIYVVEGIVDALKLWSWGFKACAILGTELLKKQRDQLLNLASAIYIVPDNDKGGLRMRTSVMRGLKGKVPLYGVDLPEGIKDIGVKLCDFQVFSDAVRKRVQIK